MVLLLISDLNLSNEDLTTLTNIYLEPEFKRKNYEILWIPIVEKPNEKAKKQFDDLKSRMPWYSLNSMAISEVTLKVMKKEWSLKQDTTTVVLLNKQGKIENNNAMTLIRVWGWEAFPFSEQTGYEIWARPGINWFKLLVTNTML